MSSTAPPSPNPSRTGVRSKTVWQLGYPPARFQDLCRRGRRGRLPRNPGVMRPFLGALCLGLPGDPAKRSGCGFSGGTLRACYFGD